ncbi:hypothetical protein CDD83_10076 [Cordyceps sp. RAO-2017]|nr:hypothetical protein CDD83_10076 [Cordyceps sp. RAO-2017]
MAVVALLGTFDTKARELLFLRDRIEDNGHVKVLLIDVGRRESDDGAVSISRSHLLSKYGGGRDISQLSRGEFVEFISGCAARAVEELCIAGRIDGIASAGGSGGTSIASSVMRRALPLGFPKLIVSTLASGDTGPIVGEADIIMMNSVVDVAGLNQILRQVFRSAGAAIAAAALSYAQHGRLDHGPESQPSRKRVGITMFGVTTPGVDAVRSYLESSYPIETFVFHATGHGGMAMERLVAEGKLDAVVDLTTTEICDLVMGGQLSAGDKRLDAAVDAGIPNIVSLGATDMANFGPRPSVPGKYQGRTLVEHNPIMTLVRSSPEDCRQIGEFIVKKLKRAKRPENIELWMPKGGVSMLAVAQGPFFNKEADEAMFSVIKDGLQGSGVKVVEDERDINDEGFARDVARALIAKMGL